MIDKLIGKNVFVRTVTHHFRGDKHMSARKVIVYHTGYGCDTGCCGHVVEVDGEEVGSFDFGHPSGPNYGPLRDEDIRQYVIDLVTEQCGVDHVADIDWDNCVVSDD